MCRALRTCLTLSFMLLLLPDSAAATIYRCQHADGGSPVFSSQPCEAQGLQQVDVLDDEHLNQRHSTFDGAGLLRRAAREADNAPPAPSRSAGETPQTAPGGKHQPRHPAAEPRSTATSSPADYCQLLQHDIDTSRQRLADSHAAQREQLLARMQRMRIQQQRHTCVSPARADGANDAITEDAQTEPISAGATLVRPLIGASMQE